MGRAPDPEREVSALGGLTESFFSIDAASGRILDCNDSAANLLGMPSSVALQGELWTRIIGSEIESDNFLQYAIQAGRRVALLPFIQHSPSGLESVLGGVYLPPAEEGSPFHLLLWPVLNEQQLGLSQKLKPADTLAVLCVDQLRYDTDWGVTDTTRLLADMRSSLLDIVRTIDTVGPQSAASILIVLSDADIEGARDICRALLSHLHRMHIRPGTATADARICVGLANRAKDKSALSTLLAANNALSRAKSSGAVESIRAATEEDYKLVTGQMLNAMGVFSETFVEPLYTEPDKVNVKSRSTLPKPPVTPIEKDIDGYVVDNMEGAVDQAIFLANLDVPVAILGPVGTGKMYVARIIHEESGGATDMLVSIDCKEFRSRSAANKRISRELEQGEGRTLVFKSPHLMSAEAQVKLARQISTRTLADVTPPRYLPKGKLIALFPEKLELLMKRGELTESLASAFAGYPITVPPIKDRKQAVLRWAHKILGQEGVLRDRDMKGFTPDAEQAMLLYDWPGNISEMRQCIFDALEKTDKDWLTPVDLGLFKGINPEGTPFLAEPKPFLTVAQGAEEEADIYIPSPLEAVHTALGEAVHSMLALNIIKPLGTWIEDELVQAALDRYRGDLPRTAEFLHTKPRNISRWMPKIESRDEERSGSSLWQNPRRLLREWVRESPQSDESPLVQMAERLMTHVNEQGGALSSAVRAKIMGVSTPTFLKRMRETADS
jgi:DNA-binding NtrC family response regulator